MTNEVISFLKERLPGFEVHQPMTTFEDNTNKDLLGNKYGNRVMAKGYAKVLGFSAATGSVKTVRIPSSDLNLWITDPFLKFTFAFTSQTRGERWIEPGGILTDILWGDVHPEGSVTAVLTMAPQKNATLRMEISVDTGNDDRPNRFIKERVAPLLIGRIDTLLEEFTGTSITT